MSSAPFLMESLDYKQGAWGLKYPMHCGKCRISKALEIDCFQICLLLVPQLYWRAITGVHFRAGRYIDLIKWISNDFTHWKISTSWQLIFLRVTFSQNVKSMIASYINCLESQQFYKQHREQLNYRVCLKTDLTEKNTTHRFVLSVCICWHGIISGYEKWSHGFCFVHSVPAI